MTGPRKIGMLLVLAAVGWGCVSVDYVGKSYPPTSNVDLYFSAADVKRPYEVIGDARAQAEVIPFTSTGQNLQAKLLAEARARGADGIILGQITSRQVGQVQQTTGHATSKKKGNKKKTDYVGTTTTSDEEVAELRGTLIKYSAE